MVPWFRLCDDGVQGRDGRCVENSSCFQIFLVVPVCIAIGVSSWANFGAKTRIPQGVAVFLTQNMHSQGNSLFLRVSLILHTALCGLFRVLIAKLALLSIHYWCSEALGRFWTLLFWRKDQRAPRFGSPWPCKKEAM